MTNPASDAQQEKQLDLAVMAYVDAEEQGGGVDVERWLAGYAAELHAELQAFADARRRLARLMARKPPAGAPAPFGHFVDFHFIARGGMGEIYSCRDTDLKRTLAMKVMHAELVDLPGMAVRFRAEAEVASQLQHPCITPVHALGQTPDGRPYFTMKLVEGNTLSQLIRAYHSQPDDEKLQALLRNFVSVCEAVALAHTRNVLHRDLKPDNVMVGEFGEVQVMDWGLTKVLEADQAADTVTCAAAETLVGTSTGATDNRTQAGTIRGTIAYMPPEQARGNGRLDARCDVFGLGAILCEILGGRPPYVSSEIDDHRRTVDLLDQAQRGDIGPVTEGLRQRHVPAPLIDLVQRCLASDVNARLGSAKEVAAGVTAYLVGVQRQLREAELAQARAEAEARAERRRRAWQFGLMLALALLLALAAWYLLERAKTDAEIQSAQREAQDKRYLGLLGVHLDRAARLDPGWTAQGLKELAEAASIPTSLRDPTVLRSEMAQCLGAIDLREADPPLAIPSTDSDRPVSFLAVDAAGKRIACCRGRPELPLALTVTLIDVAAWKIADKLHVAVNPLSGRPEGGFGDSIRALAFTPDGRWLLAGTRGGFLHRWDLEDPKAPAKTLDAHQHGVFRVVVSPDNRWAFTIAHAAKPDRLVKRWDLAAWKCDGQFALPNELFPTGIALSPDGGALFVAANDKLISLNATTFAVTHEWPGLAQHVAVGPAGGMLIAATPRPRVFDRDLTPVREYTRLGLAGRNIADTFLISPDGSLLAVRDDDYVLRVWEIASGRLVIERSLAVDVDAPMAFLPTGALVIAGANELRRVRLDNPAVSRTLCLHPWTVEAFAVSDDGRSIGCISLVKQEGDADWTVWSHREDGAALTARQRAGFGPHFRSPAICFLPAPGAGLAGAVYWKQFDTHLVHWQPGHKDSPRPGPLVPGHLDRLVCGGDGTVWASATRGRLLAWRPGLPGADSWTHPAAALANSKEQYRGLAVGKHWLALGSDDGELRMFPTDRRPLKPAVAEKIVSAAITGLAISSDETRLLVGTAAGKLVEISTADTRKIAQPQPAHRDAISDVRYLTPTTCVSASRDRFVKIWKIENGQFRELFHLQCTGPVQALAVSPEQYLFVLVAHEQGIRRWNLPALWQHFDSVGLGA